MSTSGPSSYSAPAGYGSPPPAPTGPINRIVRVRAWVTGLIAAATMLILIAAAANQKVSESILKHASNRDSFFDNAAVSVLTYSWRVSPQGGHDVGHVWLASLIADIVVIVLTFFLVVALAKGKRGFFGAFLATWISVLAATLTGRYVDAAVIDRRLVGQPNLNKVTTIFFSNVSPDNYAVAAAVVFGLVTALVAGLVASLSRRTDEIGGPAGYPPPDRPGVDEPYRGEAPAWPQQEPYREEYRQQAPPMYSDAEQTMSLRKEDLAATGNSDGLQHTAVLPAIRDEPTQAIPAPSAPSAHRDDESPSAPPSERAAENDPAEQTQALPVESAEKPAPDRSDAEADAPPQTEADTPQHLDPGAQPEIQLGRSPEEDDPAVEDVGRTS